MYRLAIPLFKVRSVTAWDEVNGSAGLARSVRVPGAGKVIRNQSSSTAPPEVRPMMPLAVKVSPDQTTVVALPLVAP